MSLFNAPFPTCGTMLVEKSLQSRRHFHFPSLTEITLWLRKKKTSKLKNYCYFAAVSNLYKCCCLMELLLVALSGCSLCFRDHSNSNCLLFPSNWLPFLLITLSFTRRSPDSLAPSRYQSFSPHALLYSRATVNSHACPTRKPIIQRKCD